MENQQQLKAQFDIKKFLVTYKFLTPEARAEFEAKLQGQRLKRLTAAKKPRQPK